MIFKKEPLMKYIDINENIEKNRLINENNQLKRDKEELIKILKAMINKYDASYVNISPQELKEVDPYRIYVTKEFLSLTKRYELIKDEKFIEFEKE